MSRERARAVQSKFLKQTHLTKNTLDFIGPLD